MQRIIGGALWFGTCLLLCTAGNSLPGAPHAATGLPLPVSWPEHFGCSGDWRELDQCAPRFHFTNFALDALVWGAMGLCARRRLDPE